MAKRMAGLFLLLLFLCGCSGSFNRDYVSVKVHEDNYAPDEEKLTEVLVASFINLKDAIVNLIANAEEGGTIHISASFDGDPAAAMARVRTEVLSENPLGAFAVEDILYSSPRLIVSYYEVEVKILYRRSPAQIFGISELFNRAAFESELVQALEGYKNYMAVMITDSELTQAGVLQLLRTLYYENLSTIVAFPEITVNFYPENSPRKVLEISFTYAYSREELIEMTETLQEQLVLLKEEFDGCGANGYSALYLARSLTALSVFDAESGALGDSVYSPLIRHRGSSVGLALAYQLFCIELGIEVYTVSGQLHGVTHSWNIIRLEDAYYHVDISQFGLYGPANRFLQQDRDMLDYGYSWDTELYPRCRGNLGYYNFS